MRAINSSLEQEVIKLLRASPLISILIDETSDVANKQSPKNNLIARSTPLGTFLKQDSILYSINNYEGNVHTNRILSHNGDIVDEVLANDGTILRAKVIGNYATDMKPNGSAVQPAAGIERQALSALSSSHPAPLRARACVRVRVRVRVRVDTHMLPQKPLHCEA